MSQAVNRLESAKDEALGAARSARLRAREAALEIERLRAELAKVEAVRLSAQRYAAECEASAATIAEAIQMVAERERRLRLYGGHDPITTPSE